MTRARKLCWRKFSGLRPQQSETNMIGKPISNDPTTGTDLDQNPHAVEPTEQPQKKVREAYGIERMELQA